MVMNLTIIITIIMTFYNDHKRWGDKKVLKLKRFDISSAFPTPFFGFKEKSGKIVNKTKINKTINAFLLN